MKIVSLFIAVAVVPFCCLGAVAEPKTYSLPDETAALRPGSDAGFGLAQGACQSCHSADYVLTQPPRKGQAFWDAEVTKMIKTYHAPIDAADAKAIAEYLATTY